MWLVSINDKIYLMPKKKILSPYGFLISFCIVFSGHILSGFLLPSNVGEKKKVLEIILRCIAQAEESFRLSIKDISAKYTEEVWIDREYQRKEVEYLEKKFGKKIEDTNNHSSYKIKYTTYIKDGKLRLDFKDPHSGKLKPLGIFDGEKVYKYIYLTTISQNKLYISKGLKPGDLLQVQIEKEPSGYLSKPLFYLGYWANEKGKVWSDELKNYNLNFIGIEKEEGENCYVMELKGRKPSMVEKGKVFVDPAIGYRVRKVIYYSPQNELASVYLYKDFKKYPGDIFLPSEVEIVLYSTTSFYGKNVPVRKQTIKFEEIKINRGLPDDFFVPSIPIGTPVFDLGTGRTYRWGEKKPTDEDVLEVAKAAEMFRKGKMRIEQLEKYRAKGQTESYSCGPNALLAVCGILGVKTSSKEIAKLAGTDERGFTTMAGLKKAAEALGLKAEGVDITLDELRKSKKLAIAYIPPDHYIVVVGFADDKVVVIDPPTMLGAVPIYSLDTLWDGRALLISKP